MKNIVIADEFRAGEIKPSKLLKAYIGMVEREIPRFFPQGELKASSCPACGGSAARRNFRKLGFVYHECASCLSLYVSMRPSDESIVRFYRTSESRAFWNRELYSSTAPRRQEKIIKPRFQWIEDSTREHFPTASSYADIHTNQIGYLAQIGELSLFAAKTLIQPVIDPATETVPPGVGTADALTGRFDVVSLFETLDHTSDVGGMFRRLTEALNPGGLCFLTGILSSGFDVKVLGEHAENIYPPDRLNVFSVKGIKALAEKHGFECLELSTPGILDVDLVAKALQENASIDVSAFIRDLVTDEDQGLRRSFQDFLQANQLSSYARVCLRKR